MVSLSSSNAVMMKKLFFLLLLGLSFTTSKAFQKEILAEVVFENLTDKPFTAGEFTNVNSTQKIKVTHLQNFNITLPEKGRYKFIFATEDFTVHTYYPERITKRNNTITIRLTQKTAANAENIYSVPLFLDSDLSDNAIANLISDGRLFFIMHSIDSSIPEEYILFKEKYGIGLHKENCAIDPMSFQIATENNQLIAAYLDRIYGDTWQHELYNKSFGL